MSRLESIENQMILGIERELRKLLNDRTLTHKDLEYLITCSLNFRKKIQDANLGDAPKTGV